MYDQEALQTLARYADSLEQWIRLLADKGETDRQAAARLHGLSPTVRQLLQRCSIPTEVEVAHTPSGGGKAGHIDAILNWNGTFYGQVLATSALDLVRQGMEAVQAGRLGPLPTSASSGRPVSRGRSGVWRLVFVGGCAVLGILTARLSCSGPQSLYASSVAVDPPQATAAPPIALQDLGGMVVPSQAAGVRPGLTLSRAKVSADRMAPLGEVYIYTFDSGPVSELTVVVHDGSVPDPAIESVEYRFRGDAEAASAMAELTRRYPPRTLSTALVGTRTVWRLPGFYASVRGKSYTLWLAD